jgi:hypothetical protein
LTFATTLDYLMEPVTGSDYEDCARCALTFERGRYADGLCPDCQTADKIIARQQRVAGAKHNSEPGFEITVHYINSRYNRSRAALRPINRAGFTYILCNVEEDPVAHHFVTDGLGHYSWPVITVTSYGRLLAHWAGLEEGYFPNRLSQLQGLWEQVQNGTAKPLIF